MKQKMQKVLVRVILQLAAKLQSRIKITIIRYSLTQTEEKLKQLIDLKDCHNSNLAVRKHNIGGPQLAG